MIASRISYSFLGSFLLTLLALPWCPTTEYQAMWSTIIAVSSAISFMAMLQWRMFGLCLLASILGAGVAIGTVLRTTHVSQPSSIENFADEQWHQLTGTIVQLPDRGQTLTRYTIEAEKLIDQAGNERHVTGRILATDRDGWPQHHTADHVMISGKLTLPEKIDDFDYPAYLSLSDVYAIVPNAHIEHSEGKNDRTIFLRVVQKLEYLKDSFELQIQRIQPEPHASLLAGLLTGSRGGMGEKLTDAFNASGLTHILAISGTNITIILSLLGSLLFFLPLRIRIPVMIAVLPLFVLFVGAGASVVRAAIMGILGLLALWSRRKTTTRLSILWTAFFMLLWNPKYLYYDAGFQLSFLAVVGIAELGPRCKRWLWFVPETLGMRESLATTMASQITTAPLSAWVFGRISLISLLSNLLAGPLIPYAMLFGFLSTAVGFLWFFLGQCVGFLAWGLLELIMRIATMGASIPYGSIPV